MSSSDKGYDNKRDKAANPEEISAVLLAMPFPLGILVKIFTLISDMFISLS